MDFKAVKILPIFYYFFEGGRQRGRSWCKSTWSELFFIRLNWPHINDLCIIIRCQVGIPWPLGLVSSEKIIYIEKIRPKNKFKFWCLKIKRHRDTDITPGVNIVINQFEQILCMATAKISSNGIFPTYIRLRDPIFSNWLRENLDFSSLFWSLARWVWFTES